MNDDIQHTKIHPYEPLDETRLQRFTKLLKTPRVHPSSSNSGTDSKYGFTKRLAELYKRYRQGGRKS